MIASHHIRISHGRQQKKKCTKKGDWNQRWDLWSTKGHYELCTLCRNEIAIFIHVPPSFIAVSLVDKRARISEKKGQHRSKNNNDMMLASTVCSQNCKIAHKNALTLSRRGLKTTFCNSVVFVKIFGLSECNYLSFFFVEKANRKLVNKFIELHDSVRTSFWWDLYFNAQIFSCELICGNHFSVMFLMN